MVVWVFYGVKGCWKKSIERMVGMVLVDVLFCDWMGWDEFLFVIDGFIFVI